MAWGITDILYKKSSDYNDPLAHYKIFVWIGMVMGTAGAIMAICSETLPDSILMVKDNLYLIPLCIFYAVAMLFGLLGKKHLDASVVSPLENIDGAMAAVILYFFFLFTGRSHVISGIGVMDIIATVAIVAGVVLLGIQEQALSKKEKNLAEKTSVATTKEEFLDVAENRPGFIKAMWCGDVECEDALKEETGGVKSRCIPFVEENFSDVCVCCGKPAKHMVVWGRQY